MSTWVSNVSQISMCTPAQSYLVGFDIYGSVYRNLSNVLATTYKGTLCFVWIYLEANDVEI